MARRTRAERRHESRKRKDEVLGNLARYIETQDNRRSNGCYPLFTEKYKHRLMRRTVRDEGSMFFDESGNRCGDCGLHACDWCVGNAYAKHERQFDAMDEDLRAYVSGDYNNITDVDGNILYNVPDAIVIGTRHRDPVEWRQV